MIRTQIYITKEEKKALEQIAAETGQSQSELIRQAINQMCQSLKSKTEDRLERLRAAQGIWADRTDLDEFYANLRKEWDRKF